VSDTPQVNISRPEMRRAVLSAIVGNGLEWFDFLISGFFAETMAKVFFPADNGVLSLILTFGTFAVGFIVRPIGGFVLGAMADRIGRQRVLSILILMMACGTLIVGLTPGYATIGLAAPLLVLAGRILQGLSVGADFGSATAMLVEFAPPGRKMFYGSFQMTTQTFGMFLASLFGFALSRTLSPADLQLWGWRVPFLLGSLIGPLGFYIRRKVAESPEFEALRRRRDTAHHAPIRAVFTHHLRDVACAAGVIIPGSTATFVWATYLPTYVVRHLHMPLTTALLSSAVCTLINVIARPFMGMLADRIGSFRLYFWSIVIGGALTWPALWLVRANPELPWLIAMQFIGVTAASFMIGPTPGLLAMLFPTEVRSTGMAFAYNVASTLGGLTPVLVIWLIAVTGSEMVPATFLVLVTGLSGLLVLFTMPQGGVQALANRALAVRPSTG
jgi:MFS transporter, MHS family, proline/betaine transporter